MAKKGIEPLEPFTKQTKTTVHRFITHEPVPRFKGFSTDGALPSLDKTDDQMDTKQWYKLSSTPGTVEYTEQRNRTSKVESIRLGQFQADAERVLRDKMGTSTSGSEARKILAEFGKLPLSVATELQIVDQHQITETVTKLWTSSTEGTLSGHMETAVIKAQIKGCYQYAIITVSDSS